MLTITKKQMEAFEKVSLDKFEDEMILHCKKFSPKVCEEIGHEKLKGFVQATIQKANSYNFTLKGPLRIFIELTLLFGNGFDTDKNYSGLSKILQSEHDEMQRSEEIYEWILDNNQKENSNK